MNLKYKRRKEKDCRENVKKELEALPYVREILEMPNLQKTNPFDKFDFFDGDTYCEYRTRNIKSTDYYTTIIPYCKIEFAKSVEQPCIILIQYQDRLMKLNVDKERNYKIKRGGRNDRFKDEYTVERI